ncbi:DUF4064 domain-containing protein [Clostridium perfringens]|nr:DUF4064 domain-containing protein [Clostridium perfringens]
MKKSAFTLGLIGGIIGIISCGMLLVIALNMKVTNVHANSVLTFSILGLLASIAGLVGACIVNNKAKVAGILMLIGTVLNVFAAFNSIGADSPINFIAGLVTAILFLIAGIFVLKK